jgi:hypothetical protein
MGSYFGAATKVTAMSIYATLWSVKFPRDGVEYPGCDWIEVVGQAVPAHIGSPTPGEGYEDGDPHGDFLPPPIETGAGEDFRAVVIVTEETKKGTERSGQEYESPLLVLTGAEYSKLTFDQLYGRICDALRGDKPRVSSICMRDGRMTVIFEDGTTREVAQ